MLSGAFAVVVCAERSGGSEMGVCGWFLSG